MKSLSKNYRQKLVKIAKKADRILKEELDGYDINHEFAEARVLDIKSVGVQGDKRTYCYPVEIMIHQTDRIYCDNGFMDKLSTRITNEIKEVNRVVYTIGAKD